jgi:hypothetical protein
MPYTRPTALASTRWKRSDRLPNHPVFPGEELPHSVNGNNGNYGGPRSVIHWSGIHRLFVSVAPFLVPKQRGKISFNAHSILSTSSRMTRIDCWFFAG